MAMPMEDVDSESGSQNGLQGVDVLVGDSAHKKEGTMVTLEKPGIPGEAHSSGCSYHRQTVSITTAPVKVFLSCLKTLKLVLSEPMIFKIAKFSMHN